MSIRYSFDQYWLSLTFNLRLYIGQLNVIHLKSLYTNINLAAIK